MIRVKIDQLFLSNMGFVVLLKGEEDERSLPIFIGAPEAQAIAIAINDVHMPRPLTHDLLKNILDFLECRLLRVVVTSLSDGTFFANLVLEKGGPALDLDCRPSDAVALAVRTGAPIFVSEDVMDEAGRVFDESELTSEHGHADSQDAEDGEVQPGREMKGSLTPLDALSHDLDRAIKDERYEDAARLRDEIKRIRDSMTGN